MLTLKELAVTTVALKPSEALHCANLARHVIRDSCPIQRSTGGPRIIPTSMLNLAFILFLTCKGFVGHGG